MMSNAAMSATIMATAYKGLGHNPDHASVSEKAATPRIVRIVRFIGPVPFHRTQTNNAPRAR